MSTYKCTFIVHWSKFDTCEIINDKIIISGSQYDVIENVSIIGTGLTTPRSGMKVLYDAAIAFAPSNQYFMKSRTYGADTLNLAISRGMTVWAKVPRGLIQLNISGAELINKIPLYNIDELVAAMYGCNFECA